METTVVVLSVVGVYDIGSGLETVVVVELVGEVVDLTTKLSIWMKYGGGSDEVRLGFRRYGEKNGR